MKLEEIHCGNDDGLEGYGAADMLLPRQLFPPAGKGQDCVIAQVAGADAGCACGAEGEG